MSSPPPVKLQSTLGFADHARRVFIYMRSRVLKRSQEEENDKNAPVPSTLPSAQEVSPVILRVFQEVTLTRYAARLLGAANAIGVGIIIVLLCSALYASMRDEYTVNGGTPLAESIKKRLRGEPCSDYGRLVLFVRTTLESLNQVDLEENPLREVLKPLMSTEVWDKKTVERRSLGAAFRQMNVTQSCAVKSIGGIVVNEGEHRVRCYVRGFITLLVLNPPDSEGKDGPTPKSRTLPWRAEIIARVGVPNEVNPFEFYMISLTEKTGAAALKWDNQQKQP